MRSVPVLLLVSSMVSPDGRWFSFSRRYGETRPTTTDAEIYRMDASIIEDRHD